ncbi:MAG: hypothetical protein MPN21_01305 [Thermoanaerobaculia bacterium]|nr:hypothetical protein [Thermoanaerobaculia bacterium]
MDHHQTPSSFWPEIPEIASHDIAEPRSARSLALNDERDRGRIQEVDDPTARSLVCQLASHSSDPRSLLDTLPEQILVKLRGNDEVVDLYHLAVGMYELGSLRSAVALLEHTIRYLGLHLHTCELMAKCLLALERPELALRWLLQSLSELDLDFDQSFELLRLASICRMQMRADA